MIKEILDLLKTSKDNKDKRQKLIENEDFFLKLIKIVESYYKNELKNKETLEMNSEEISKEIKALNIRKELFGRLQNVKYKNDKST